jgi:DNA primase
MPKVTVEDVAEYLEQFHGDSTHGWALCCFHPDTKPSLRLLSSGYRCMSCGEHGSLEWLLQKVSGRIVIREKTYNPASFIWRNWQEKFGSIKEIAKVAHNNLVNNPDTQHYLKQRKIDSQIKQGYLGYAEGYYIFPIRDEYGEVLGLTARTSPTIQTKNNRYSVTKDCPQKIYVPNWKRVNKEDCIYVCYGTLDVWTLEMCGLAGITGLSGQQLKPEYLDRFRKPIYIIPDKGEEKQAIELQSSLGWRGMPLYLDFPEGTKDLNQIHQEFGLDTVSKLIEKAKERYNYE